MVVYAEPRSHTKPVKMLTSQTSRMKASTPFPHAFNATGCTILSPTIAGQLFSLISISIFLLFLSHTPLSLSLSETVTIISKSVLLSTNEGFGFVHLRYSIHLGVYGEERDGCNECEE